jgi:hypothetical protein
LPVPSKVLAPAPIPETIPPSKWPGRSFLILEKVAMFRQYGLYLYSSPALQKSTAPCNPEIELPNHRLKYEPFAGTSIQILSSVRQKDGEYIITAQSDANGIKIYGKTVKGVIEGLLLSNDLAQARSRWTGAAVYSRRRMIDVYDSANSVFENIRVSINEPLMVIDVRPGIIPLPPKPVWIVVERSDKTQGFIPVNWSWTNVPAGKITGGSPYESDIFEKQPRSIYPQWDEYVWSAIDNHSIFTGMLKEQVLMTWGNPQSITNISGLTTEWIFQKSRIRIAGDTVFTISEK